MISFLKISKFFLYLVPLTVIIVYQGSIFPFIVGKYAFFRTMIQIALILFVWGWAMGESGAHDKQPADKNRQHKLLVSPLVITVTLFVLIFLLAGFLGYNPSASFWSNFERGEGGLQIISLLIFFILLTLLFREKSSWHRIFVVSIWAALLMIAYGAAAALHVGSFIGSDFCSRFAGSLGNPAYLGTYMIFAIFYSSYLFVGSSESRAKWKFLVLAILFFVFLLLSQTRGALLGLGVAVLSALIYLFFVLKPGRARKIVLACLAVLIILGPLGLIFRRQINIMPFCLEETGGNRILNVSFAGETYQTRLLLWAQSFKAFKERPILGWGPENFSIAFEKYFDTRHTAWFDRAHNIFFDYLIFAGLLGLLSFIGIFIAFYFQFIKFSKKLAENDSNSKRRARQSKEAINNQLSYEKALIFSLPIAYLIQGLVLFDVLPIYINIFLFLAFANYKFNENITNQ